VENTKSPKVRRTTSDQTNPPKEIPQAPQNFNNLLWRKTPPGEGNPSKKPTEVPVPDNGQDSRAAIFWTARLITCAIVTAHMTILLSPVDKPLFQNSAERCIDGCIIHGNTSHNRRGKNILD
jgi:hypothetical protein